MNELERALVGDSYAAPPAHILDGLGDNLAHREITGALHTIYEEVWLLAAGHTGPATAVQWSMA